MTPAAGDRFHGWGVGEKNSELGKEELKAETALD